jgi:hypothetical protein
VLVKALKEHGSKGRLKLPGKALLQPGKAKVTTPSTTR